MEPNDDLAALLLTDDGKLRPCCPGCALALEGAGLLQCIYSDGEGLLVFKIAATSSLAECRAFVQQQKHGAH